MRIQQSQFITCPPMGDVCPVFRFAFMPEKPVCHARLEVTALGVYEAELNGNRVGDFILAPGWTAYQKRLQVQSYDVTSLLRGTKNELRITVGRGWFRSPMPGWEESEDKTRRVSQPCGLIAALALHYADGGEELFFTNEHWQVGEGPIRFSEIYDGEVYDANFEAQSWAPALALDWPKDILIPQEGEPVRETERLAAKRIFQTPAGETVVDFGQEVTGYVELCLHACAGDRVRFTHGEMLDAKGNFYRDNYRSAKAEVDYLCRDGIQCWHPRLTFFGFRYLKLLDFPGEARTEHFTAIAVHSALRRTGFLESGDAPGFSSLRFAPHPCRALGWLRASLETRHGRIRCAWRYDGDLVCVELDTPVPATAALPSGIRQLAPGKYTFWEQYA